MWLQLDTDKAPDDLWWLSVHGIYRLRPDLPVGLGVLSNPNCDVGSGANLGVAGELHPKYKVAMQCFAYVGAVARFHAHPLQIAAVLGAVNLAAAGLLLAGVVRQRRRPAGA